MGQAKIRREAIARGEPDPMPQNRGLKSPGRIGMKILEAERHKWFKGGPPPVVEAPKPHAAVAETPTAPATVAKKAARKKAKPEE